MGKCFQLIHVNSLFQNLGELKCKGLPFFHSFTGCDTTSQFHGKGKKLAWEAWKSYPSVTEAFQFALAHPFQHLAECSPVFQLLECFTCVLYDKTTSISKVNELRQDLFSKKARAMENIPPTKVKLTHQHYYLFIHRFASPYFFSRLRFYNMQIEPSTKPVYGQCAFKHSKILLHLNFLDGQMRKGLGNLCGHIFLKWQRFAKNF